MKKRMMAISAITNMILILIFIFVRKFDLTNLIIVLGINMAKSVQLILSILLIAIFIAFNIIILRIMIKSKPQKIEMFTIEDENIHDEKAIRGELKKFIEIRPSLNTELSQALEQMDSIDRKQLKTKEIFERNKIRTLTEVEDTIQKAEDSILKNIIRIINRANLWDSAEWNKDSKKDIYDEHRTSIHNLLEQNESILSKSDRLLAETIKYIDEKDSDSESGQMHLDAMTETIAVLTKTVTKNIL